MSYATIKFEYTEVLRLLGYSECKNLLEFKPDAGETPLAYNHLWYVMKPEGFTIEPYMNNSVLSQHKFRLEVRYKNVNTSERDANYQLFIIMVDALCTVASGKYNVEDPTFIDEPDKMHTIGTFIFYAGIEGC